MQDDFNNATTAPGQPTPLAAPGAPRPAGQPLGVVQPNAPQGQAQAGGQAPGQAGGQAGQQTASYHGPVSLDSATIADPQAPPAWPGLASPFAPTVHRPQPSEPKPPIYQPPDYTPAAAPALPAPYRAPAAPAARIPTRVSAPAPQRASRPRAASAPAQLPPASAGRWAAWIPLPHTLLIVGVALLLLATRLPWGVDSSGVIIMLQTASIPALATPGDGGGTALQVAYNLIGAIGVLSAGLLFFNIVLSGLNKVLGRGCLAGCVVVPLYPILLALIGSLLIAQVLAAGFGGLGVLAQAPAAQSYGLAGLGVAHYEPGYYLWYTGIIVNVVGMLGEFVVWRR